MKKIMSCLLAVILLMANTSMVFADTGKQEVVYVSLGHSGSVSEINTVNVFDLNEPKTIIDYGDYSLVENMTTTDPVTMKDGKIQISAKEGRLYYKGKMKEKIMPWAMEIKYQLDGKEYSAEELAGKSGKLKITMSTEKNPDCKSIFYKHYALQTTFLLNTDKVSNIITKGATKADAGVNKQLTYTFFPGKGGDIEIQADVKDFEMEPITINGVRLNMDVEMDNQSLEEKVSQLVQGTDQINKGADGVESGVNSLRHAVGVLNGKTDQLTSGTKELKAGATSLQSGLTAIDKQSNQLKAGGWTAYKAMCTAAENQINPILEANSMNGITLTPSNYGTILDSLSSSLEGNTALAVSRLKSQLDSYGDFYNGLVEYTGAVGSVSQGANNLSSGLAKLYDNTGKLAQGVEILYGATEELYQGSDKLAKGTGEFAEKTSGIDEIFSSISGDDSNEVSFVSAKNSNVKSVQFVIKTEGIKTTEPEHKEKTTEPQSFWQKLLSLFQKN